MNAIGVTVPNITRKRPRHAWRMAVALPLLAAIALFLHWLIAAGTALKDWMDGE